MADIITQEKLIELREAATKAQESTIPFPIVKDGDMAVVGDANKTELNKHDFDIDFLIPGEDGEYVSKTVQYNDVYLKPRHAVTVQRAMTSIMPMLYKIKPGGSVEEYTDEELQEVANTYEGNVLEQIYYLVSVVLGIDTRLIEWAVPDSIMKAFHKIMQSYPDLVKASESFFGSSSSKKTKGPSKNE